MKFGVTQPFTCSYLPERQEQLLVYMPEQDAMSAKAYDKLIHSGFRRSGDQIYRPHCAQCSACHSIRVLTYEFTPSRSQKRVLNKNRDITIVVNDAPIADVVKSHPAYFALYAKYITQRHADGSMYPPNLQNFTQFLGCEWETPLLVEAWLHDELVGVAVTDKTVMGLSAFYTFFSPDYPKRSLGVFMILQQIQLSASMHKPYLFLGYQIDDCTKMNYKKQYQPYERFNGEYWVRSTQ